MVAGTIIQVNWRPKKIHSTGERVNSPLAGSQAPHNFQKDVVVLEKEPAWKVSLSVSIQVSPSVLNFLIMELNLRPIEPGWLRA